MTPSPVLVTNTGQSSRSGLVLMPSDGEINLALMEPRHSQQPVMDAIHLGLPPPDSFITEQMSQNVTCCTLTDLLIF